MHHINETESFKTKKIPEELYQHLKSRDKNYCTRQRCNASRNLLSLFKNF